MAILGLVGTNVWTIIQFQNQHAQIEGQREQLAESRRQFELTRGYLEVEAWAAVWSRDRELWLPESYSPDDQNFDDQRLSYEDFVGITWVALKVTNVGGADTRITDAGVLLDESGSDLAGGDPLCQPEEDATGFLDCKFPLSVSAQSTMTVYVPINDLTSDLTCNEYVEKSGLVGAVRALDGTLGQSPTTTSVPFSNDCNGPAVPGN